MAIEQLVTLKVAAELIPMSSVSALYQFLGKHKNEFPARYKNRGGPDMPLGGVDERFLSESEILRIRDMIFKDASQVRFFKGKGAGRPKGVRNGQGKAARTPFGYVMRRLAEVNG